MISRRIPNRQYNRRGHSHQRIGCDSREKRLFAEDQFEGRYGYVVDLTFVNPALVGGISWHIGEDYNRTLLFELWTEPQGPCLRTSDGISQNAR